MHDLYSRFLKSELGPSDEPEDHHRRTANDVEADRLIAARRALLLRFLPFVLLEDQNLPPAELLETVAARLYEEARTIRRTMPVERVVSVNPHGENTTLAEWGDFDTVVRRGKVQMPPATYQGVGNVPDETADRPFIVRRGKVEMTPEQARDWVGHDLHSTI